VTSTRAQTQWPDQRDRGSRRMSGGWILFTSVLLGLLAGVGAALMSLY
jgi:hypothetical protein